MFARDADFVFGARPCLTGLFSGDREGDHQLDRHGQDLGSLDEKAELEERAGLRHAVGEGEVEEGGGDLAKGEGFSEDQGCRRKVRRSEAASDGRAQGLV